jgi:hypothetical protein
MKHPGKKTLRLVVAAAGAVVVAVLAVGASASREDKWYIGINLHFTGPTTTEGTFVMSGAVEDFGTSHVENIVLEPIGKTDTARLSGDQTYVGAKGTIVTRFEGKGLFLSSPHQVGKGQLDVISGTGAYAGLEGHAHFLIVVHTLSNQLMGTAEGHATSQD